MGINASIAFFTGKQRYGLSELWTASIAIGLALSLCAVFTGLWIIPLALRHYSPSVQNLALIFLAVAPVIWLSGCPPSFLQGKLDLVSSNLIRAVAPLVYSVGLVFLLWLKRPYLRDVVTCQVLGFALAFVFGNWLLFTKLKIHLAWDSGALLSLLKFGGKTHLGSLASYVNQRADQLILSIFVQPRELGLYVVAVTAATVVVFFPQAAGIVTLAAGANAPPGGARKVIAESFRASLAWLLLACTVLYIFAPVFIRFFFGPAFIGSVAACRILLPGMVALGLTQVLYEGARALEQPSLPSYAEIISMAVTCGGLYLLLPRFGFIGAAIASTLAYSTACILMLVFCRSRMQIGMLELLGVSRAAARVATKEMDATT